MQKTWIKTVRLIACVLPLIGMAGCSKQPPRVYYINSYHQGFHSSDETMAGIENTLEGHNIDLKIHIMDTKRNPQVESIEKQAQLVLEEIRVFNPDLIIASDDNAVKYVIAPYFSKGPIPVLFCGVNWTCWQYDLPTPFVTGMLEVLPVIEVITALKAHYPAAKRLTVLSELSTTERKNKEILDPVYKKLGFKPTYALVPTFDEWKQEFLKANKNSDLIFLFTNGAIQGWNDADAKQFVGTHIRKPIFTVEEHMMPFAVIGFSKVAREQGVWVATTALDILSGTPIETIALTKNQQTRNYLNPTLAQKINFVPGKELLATREVIED